MYLIVSPRGDGECALVGEWDILGYDMNIYECGQKGGAKSILPNLYGLGVGCRIAILVCFYSSVSGVGTELKGSAQVY
jgi:hypothetical protein